MMLSLHLGSSLTRDYWSGSFTGSPGFTWLVQKSKRRKRLLVLLALNRPDGFIIQ